MIISIENRTDVVKDKESAAILVVDHHAFHVHINKRKKEKQMVDTICSLEEKVNRLEQAIAKLINN